MKLEVAQALVEAAADIGVEMDIYEDYSGRSMYGTKTTGVTYASEVDLMKAAAYVAGAIGDGSIDTMELPDFIDELPSRRDNMGHDFIAY